MTCPELCLATEVEEQFQAGEAEVGHVCEIDHDIAGDGPAVGGHGALKVRLADKVDLTVQVDREGSVDHSGGAAALHGHPP
ncbi:MAG TPA: hypothetical protein VFP72_03505 [Kineosporiaceae bacterium]|nr:hypothetical protein [Kineosporiaceae bacterium]